MTIEEWVVCQTPIRVGGIGIPEFRSLYVAGALGAVVYLNPLHEKTNHTIRSQGVAIGQLRDAE